MIPVKGSFSPQRGRNPQAENRCPRTFPRVPGSFPSLSLWQSPWASHLYRSLILAHTSTEQLLLQACQSLSGLTSHHYLERSRPAYRQACCVALAHNTTSS